MFYKLSISNIKKSFKDYTIYFVTLMLGVCIFYIFNSMDSQTAMLELTSNQGKTVEFITMILSYVSILVSIILGSLIIYASRFLIKKRNKEFGIYMTLGMSKRKIAFILLLETFIIGVISLVVGLILGIALSQVTSIFIANMFEINMTKFTFNFSKAAMVKTIIYFGIIYFVVMIFNTIIISKNKLINLIQSSKKHEKIKFKNPIICIILFIISIIMLARVYYLLSEKSNEVVKSPSNLLIMIVFLILGTILFFYSLAGILLKLLSKCHKIYSNKLNTFVFKQVSSKINTMVASISIISIMLFITLCILSSALTIKEYFNDSIRKYAPVDFQLMTRYDDESKNVNLNECIENNDVIKNNTKDITIVNKNNTKDFTYGSALGDFKDELEKEYPYMRIQYNNPAQIISESDYNKMAKVYKCETVDLENYEYAIVSNFETGIYRKLIDKEKTLNIFGNDLKPYKKIVDGFDGIGFIPYNLGFFVVKDSIIRKDDKNTIVSSILIGNYNTKNEKVIEDIEKRLEDCAIKFGIIKMTRLDMVDSTVALTLTATFIALYLGIIFLISSSAILALKELSDCLDDRNKYKILRQIGADEKDINKALFKQTFILFILPLVVASIHTIFGLKFVKYLLYTFMGTNDILNGCIKTFAFLIGIYGIYFVITYICSKNIIKERTITV